jgi:ABC-type thiamine transport system substrate-binding protein
MANHWLYPSIQKKLSLPVDSERLKKLRRIAKQKNKTLTQSIEEWIDKLKKEKPSREGRGFRLIISGNLRF